MSVPATELSYLQDTYKFEQEASLVESGYDKGEGYFIFDKTIFHPQGGGQPSDKGYIEVNGKQYEVEKLAEVKSSTGTVVKHYFVDEPELTVGMVCKQVIDAEARKEFARIHSAGHLLSNAVHMLYPSIDGCNGNHFPGNVAFVTVMTEGQSLKPSDIKKEDIQKKVNELIAQHLPCTNLYDAEPRTIQFGELPAYPCGGTHVDNTDKIGDVTIRSVKKNKNKETGFDELRIGYNLKA